MARLSSRLAGLSKARLTISMAQTISVAEMARPADGPLASVAPTAIAGSLCLTPTIRPNGLKTIADGPRTKTWSVAMRSLTAGLEASAII